MHNKPPAKLYKTEKRKYSIDRYVGKYYYNAG
jgi:hypothetical protein